MNSFRQDSTEINMESKIEKPSDNFAGIIRKLNEETSAEGEKWFREGRKVPFILILWRMIARFVAGYFFKGNLRYGYMGLMSAVSSSLYPLLSYTKYWELIERERGRM